MKIEILKEYQGKKVRLILKNNFSYSNVIFEISKDDLICFFDRLGDKISLEPDFIVGISEISNSGGFYDDREE